MLLVILVMLGNLARLHFFGDHRVDTVVTAASTLPPPAGFTPYTVVLKEIRLTPTGPEPGARLVTAVREDGASASIFEYLEPNEQNKQLVRRTMRFPDGRRVELDDLAEEGFAVKDLRGVQGRLLRDPRTRCLNRISGLPASGTQKYITQETLGGESVHLIEEGRTTFWLAEGLGCAELKYQTDLGAEGMNEKRLVSLVKGTPEQWLFDVPAHYREVSASQFHNLEPTSEAAARRDDWYAENGVPLHGTEVR